MSRERLKELSKCTPAFPQLYLSISDNLHCRSFLSLCHDALTSSYFMAFDRSYLHMAAFCSTVVLSAEGLRKGNKFGKAQNFPGSNEMVRKCPR